MTEKHQGEILSEDEDCPLCCCPLSIADRRYPLYCPAVTCRFNFCSDCIRRFVKAASEGYQVASDGSRQMRITVQCPMCRSKYETQKTALKYPSDIIIDSVLILRNATEMEGLLKAKDSELNASSLAKRQRFALDSSMEELINAFTRLQVYQASLLSNDRILRKEDEEINTLRLIPLNWEAYRTVLRENRNKESSPSSAIITYNRDKSSNSHKNDKNNLDFVCWKDPTLFGGLEESLTVSEHEFLTSIMTSGEPELLAQSASIMYSVMDMISSRRARCLVQQLDGFQHQAAMNHSSPVLGNYKNNANIQDQESVRPVRLSNALIDHMQRIRKRFPLPVNMPRCVSIPFYDPSRSKECILEFTKDKCKQFTLTLNSVSGYAGRVGLRKGDTVTHVDGSKVGSYDELVTAFKHLQQCRTGTVQIIVNATQAVATTLKNRARDMKQSNIRFHY